MEPFQRFKTSNTQDNLWIYLLSLGKEREITNEEAAKLIFERYGFLPGKILLSRVLYRLRNQRYISKEKFKGKSAFKTTEKGSAELEKMKSFLENLIEELQ